MDRLQYLWNEFGSICVDDGTQRKLTSSGFACRSRMNLMKGKPSGHTNPPTQVQRGFAEAILDLSVQIVSSLLLRTIDERPETHAIGTHPKLGARLRGRTATQRSKKGSWKGFLGRGSQKGSEKGACFGFYSKKGF